MLFALLVGGVVLVPASAVAAAFVTLAVRLWRGEFHIERLRLAWAGLAFCAAVGGIWFGLQTWHDPSYCRIEF
ncbi:MAG: hypothetical protein M3N13_01585 [Candidatus Eremiobacteraeota bacterium]|nr:hypothetical protein [Candidatus Eremiobacteraeota bacterium]